MLFGIFLLISPKVIYYHVRNSLFQKVWRSFVKKLIFLRDQGLVLKRDFHVNLCYCLGSLCVCSPSSIRTWRRSVSGETRDGALRAPPCRERRHRDPEISSFFSLSLSLFLSLAHVRGLWYSPERARRGGSTWSGTQLLGKARMSMRGALPRNLEPG